MVLTRRGSCRGGSDALVLGAQSVLGSREHSPLTFHHTRVMFPFYSRERQVSIPYVLHKGCCWLLLSYFVIYHGKQMSQVWDIQEVLEFPPLEKET